MTIKQIIGNLMKLRGEDGQSREAVNHAIVKLKAAEELAAYLTKLAPYQSSEFTTLLLAYRNAGREST
jgi:hypothetical protein